MCEIIFHPIFWHNKKIYAKYVFLLFMASVRSRPPGPPAVPGVFKIMFLARDKLAEGIQMSELTYPTMPVPNCIANDSLEVMSDFGDEWGHFTSDLDSSLSDL